MGATASSWIKRWIWASTGLLPTTPNSVHMLLLIQTMGDRPSHILTLLAVSFHCWHPGAATDN